MPYLRVLRDKLKLSQPALAEASGVPQSTIARLETEPTRPIIDTVLNLARALGVEPRDLQFGPPPKAAKRKRRAA